MNSVSSPVSSRKDDGRRNSNPPTPSGYPVIGNGIQFLRANDPIRLFDEFHQEYGDFVKLKIFNEVAYLTRNPADANRIFEENNSNYRKSSMQSEGFDDFFGKDILNSQEDRWRKQRKLLTPVISRRRLEEFAPEWTTYATEMMDRWEEGESLDIHHEMMSLTAKVACKVLFNWDSDDYGEAIGQNLKTVTGHLFRRSIGLTMPQWVPTRENKRYEAARRTIESISDEIIEHRRNADDDFQDIISRTLDAEDELDWEVTNELLRHKVHTLLFAGHETTAQGLTFALYLLSRYPQVGRRLRAELDAQLGGSTPTVEDVRDLPYLDAFIRESWRLYPPAYSVVREALEADSLSGYDVPAGSTVMVFSYGIQRNPRVWDRPYAFEPERWMDDGPTVESDYAFMPFGAGPRRCAGEQFATLESKLILATVLQRFDVELVSDPKIDFETAVTTRPAGAIEMVPHEL